MSTLKADTLVAADGTSPVTLTKQEAIKCFFIFNQSGTSHRTDIGTNTAGSESLNVSSHTDVGTGDINTNFTNSFTNKQWVAATASWNANKLICVNYENQTTSLFNSELYDGDTGSLVDGPHECFVIGDLA